MWLRRPNLRKLERRCRDVVHRLDIPQPFDIRALCRQVGRQRERPVHLVSIALPAAGPCGLWLDTPRGDYIIVESNTSPMHRDHIALHELAHVLSHRHGVHGLDTGALPQLFPDVDPRVVRMMLGRTRYSALEEQEAEIFAHLVLDRVWRFPVASPTSDSVDAHVLDVLRRFAAGLEAG